MPRPTHDETGGASSGEVEEGSVAQIRFEGGALVIVLGGLARVVAVRRELRFPQAHVALESSGRGLIGYAPARLGWAITS